MGIRRGFTRVFGTVRNTLLVAFVLTGMNVRMLRDWHAKRHLGDPWPLIWASRIWATVRSSGPPERAAGR